MTEDQDALENFSGITRLFPLPNLTFFPGAHQPLHIFEPRYRELLADSLAEDRLISLVLLEDGWDKNYDETPGLHPIACLGRVIADQLLPDGRYNLLLRGIARVRIIEEIPGDKPYRQARVEVLLDESDSDVPTLMALRTEMSDLILPRILHEQLRTQLAELFTSEMPLGRVSDIIGFALPIPLEVKQKMLGELRVVPRARLLIDGFRSMLSASGSPSISRRFPPGFSEN